LPPGIAQHAELRALVEGGLDPVDAIRAATVDAATALGLGLSTGRVATGADANFILVLGDPANAINDAANVVGVVQNGRFMSLGRLLDTIPAQ
jgi:imidazolonepropionase-like amidohydrolase